ncbi:hypothetical protein B0H12DRAFT_1186910 [Mycena haematopus]|nr:hypothetical protein B0H12DRAFT_1186910 [Mycena haematopus]
MIHLLSLYIAVAVSFMTIAQAAQPSGTPGCTATCPPQDKSGFHLGNHSNSGGVLFCSYPAVAGEDQNDFFCTYNSASGSPIHDNDVGLCPGSAPVSCNTRRFKGEDNYTAMLRKREGAMKPRTSDPRTLKARKPSVLL